MHSRLRSDDDKENQFGQPVPAWECTVLEASQCRKSDLAGRRNGYDNSEPVQIEYDGPIRAAPFSKELDAMDRGAALTATAQAMKNSFTLVQPD